MVRKFHMMKRLRRFNMKKSLNSVRAAGNAVFSNPVLPFATVSTASLLTQNPRPGSTPSVGTNSSSRGVWSASFRASPDTKELSKYISIGFAEQLLASNRKKIIARNPQSPPSLAGLLAIIGFTSCGLDRRFKDATGDRVSSTDEKTKNELRALHTLANETRLQIATTRVPEARRNSTLNLQGLMQYEIGKIITFPDLVNVTLTSKQVYSGGNIDFVYKPALGKRDLEVVDVSMLSDFTHQETEGYLEPCSAYRVEHVLIGKENGGRPSPLNPEEYPPVTIVLRQI